MVGKAGSAGEGVSACDIAVVGAGPVGLMTANLLGAAGLRVEVFERNADLLGLPRAIAYDAETLRLFAQIGLFDEIAPGLVQDPLVRHLNARGKALMEAKFPAASMATRRSEPSTSPSLSAPCLGASHVLATSASPSPMPWERLRRTNTG